MALMRSFIANTTSSALGTVPFKFPVGSWTSPALTPAINLLILSVLAKLSAISGSSAPKVRVSRLEFQG